MGSAKGSGLTGFVLSILVASCSCSDPEEPVTGSSRIAGDRAQPDHGEAPEFPTPDSWASTVRARREESTSVLNHRTTLALAADWRPHRKPRSAPLSALIRELHAEYGVPVYLVRGVPDAALDKVLPATIFDRRESTVGAVLDEALSHLELRYVLMDGVVAVTLPGNSMTMRKLR